MKYVAIALMSLLLLGDCSARSYRIFDEFHSSDQEANRPREMDDNMKQREADYSKDTQGYRPEGAQNKAEDQNSQRWAELRETVYRKLGNMYHQLTSSQHTFQIDSIPDLADPVYVGKFEDQYGMHSIHYENVQFQGMRSVDQAVVSVDTDSKEVTLTLSMKSAEISGNYEDSAKKVSGSFNVQMFGDLAYVSTYRYQLQEGNKVQLQHVGSKLNYNKFIHQYANANFPDFVQNAQQAALLRAIDEKVHAELSHKFGHQIQQSIQAALQGHPQDSAEKVMGEGIKKAISGIQQVLWKRGVSSVELTSDDKEMVYNKLHAKIASVKLNGLQKFYLANTQVSNENADKIRAKLQFAIAKPTATAEVNIHESHEENAPFQKIRVDFDMDQLMADLSLEKASRQSGLELRSVQTKVERIRPMSTDKYQGEVSSLIRDKLTGHMKRYVEEGLKTFIQNEYLYSVSRGVQPPSQEKQSASNQM